MKVAEAMLLHKVDGEKLQSVPCFHKVLFFSWLPKRSSTNVISDVECVLGADTGYTADKEKRESNPIFVEWFHFSFLFYYVGQGLKLLTILFRDTFAI